MPQTLKAKLRMSSPTFPHMCPRASAKKVEKQPGLQREEDHLESKTGHSQEGRSDIKGY